MKPCSVCSGNFRSQVDVALAGGQSVRQVAAQFGSSKSAVARHHQRCKASSAAATVAPIPAPNTGETEIDAAIARLRRAEANARRRRDVEGALAISRELRHWLTLKSKTESTALARPANEQPVTRAEAIQMSKVLIEAEVKASNPEICEWLREIVSWLPAEASCETEQPS